MRFETLEERRLLSLSTAGLDDELAPVSPCCIIAAAETDTRPAPSHELACAHDRDDAPYDAYQASTRWSATASQGGGLSWGDATTLTWSIVPDGTPIGGLAGETAGASNFIAFMNGLYGSVSGPLTSQPWFSVVESVFESWADVSGLRLVYEPHDDGAAVSSSAAAAPGALGVRGDIRIGGHAIDGNGGTLAYNFYPNHGEMVVDTADAFYANTADDSLRLRNVMTHELGHGLGLAHVEPVDHTKLMEPYATTAFDGPQHDDILAIQRLYGDQFEDGRGNDTAATATRLATIPSTGWTVGDWADGEYASIDGATDLDYYRFSVPAGTSLDVTLTPLGLSYQAGPQGATPSTLDTRQQNNLSLELLTAGGARIASAASGGMGASERLAGVSLASGGEYLIRVRGDRDAAQFYQLDLVAKTAPAVTSGSLTGTAWNDADADGIRDAGEAALAGRMVYLDANANGRLDAGEFQTTTDAAGRYTMTSVGAGTYRITQILPSGWQATAGSLARTVKVVAGKAVAVNLGSRSVASPPSGEWLARADHYSISEDAPWTILSVLANDTIPAGQNAAITAIGGWSHGEAQIVGGTQIAYRPAAGFTGTETLTYTVSDGTRATPASAEVTVTVNGATIVAETGGALDFRQHAVGSYAGANDGTGGYWVEDGGATLHLTGNVWKRIDLPYTVTSQTVLEFDFRSGREGEIHAIGVDDDLNLSPASTVQLYGTQTWGRCDVVAEYGGSGWSHYRVSLGTIYRGQARYLFFAADHDVRLPVADSVFRNVRIYEASASTAQAIAAVPTADLAAYRLGWLTSGIRPVNGRELAAWRQVFAEGEADWLRGATRPS